MQKPIERNNFTSDNNIIKFKKPVHELIKTVQILSYSLILNLLTLSDSPSNSKLNKIPEYMLIQLLQQYTEDMLC